MKILTNSLGKSFNMGESMKHNIREWQGNKNILTAALESRGHRGFEFLDSRWSITIMKQKIAVVHGIVVDGVQNIIRSWKALTDHALLCLDRVVTKMKFIFAKELRNVLKGSIVKMLLSMSVATISWTLVLTKYLSRKGQVDRLNPLLVLTKKQLEKTYENINSYQNKIHSELVYEAVFSSLIGQNLLNFNLINRKRSFV